MPNSPYIWGPNAAINLQPAGGEIDQATGRLRIDNGPQNLIGYNNFENGLINGWALGTIGALTNGLPTGAPTFGGGGTAVALTASTSAPISGTTSLLLTATAATTVGNMIFSDPLPINSGIINRVVNFMVNYNTNGTSSVMNLSGTSANTIAWALYDVNNAVWIPVTGNFNFVQGNGVGQCSGTAQIPGTASVRLCLYFPAATTGACTISFDDFYLGPNPQAIGFAGNDWQSFTPTGSWTTNSAYAGRYRRVGDTAEIQVELVLTGAPSAGNLTLNLPPGLVIDTAKLANGTGVLMANSSAQLTTGSGSAGWFGGMFYSTTTSVLVKTNQTTPAGTFNTVTPTVPGTFGNGDALNFKFDVPIAGWSSNTVQSSDTDTRVIAFVAGQQVPTGTITGTLSITKFGTVTQDTAGGYSTSTGLYTVPVTGFYSIQGCVEVTGTSPGVDNATRCAVVKSGTSVYLSGQVTGNASGAINLTVPLSATVFCNTGDTLAIYTGSALTSPTYGSGSTSSYLAIFRLSGPAVIQANASITFKAVNTAGTSIANTGDNNVPFATVVFDSASAWTGTQYRIPISGKYSIKGTINYTSATYGVNNQLIASVYKNAAIDTYGDIAPVMAIVTLPFGSVVDTTVQCSAGDLLEVRAQNTRTAGATTLNTGAGMNHIEIERIGN